MLNALKAPSLSHFRDEVEELVKEKSSKYKKLLFFLFSVLLSGAVFILYPNQDGIIEPSIKSLEKPATPPPEDQETKPAAGKNKVEQTKQNPASELVQTEPVQSKPASPSFKDDKKEFAFKRDKEYLAIDRFERPSWDPKVSRISTESVRDTLAVVDKPLVLAGRGFDIKGFQSHSREGIETDFLRHLKRPVPKMDHVSPDHLDLQLSQAKSSKHLIFHPLGPALSEHSSLPQWKDSEFSKMKPQVLETIPETKLLFNESEKSDLILRPGSDSLDLLIGNEKINRKTFDNW